MARAIQHFLNQTCTFTDTMVRIITTGLLVGTLVILTPVWASRYLTTTQRYPFWSHYLNSTEITVLDVKLQAPLVVWPARVFQNYTKLKWPLLLTWFNFNLSMDK